MAPKKGRITSEIHSAKAAMAGFLFQIRRALNRLAGSGDETTVSIETLDDVVVENGEGLTIVEQDKLSFQRNPIPDRSENLWKTLTIWMGLVDGGEVQLKNTQFHLVSTFPVNTGVAAMLKESTDLRDNHRIINELLKIAKNPGKDCISYTKRVTEWPRTKLLSLIENIIVTDQSCSDSKTSLENDLNLDSSIKDDVIRGLTGWLTDITLDHFSLSAATEDEQPLCVKSSDFKRELSKLITKHFNNQIVLRTSQEIVDPKSEIIEQSRGARFVKQIQLLALDHEESEVILDSILEYLKADEETTRLAKQNEVTRSKFKVFENDLHVNWKYCKRKANLSSLLTEEKIGYSTFLESLNCNALLDGQPVIHSFFTRGTYHAMANRTKQPCVGWHPRFEELL